MQTHFSKQKQVSEMVLAAALSAPTPKKLVGLDNPWQVDLTPGKRRKRFLVWERRIAYPVVQATLCPVYNRATRFRRLEEVGVKTAFEALKALGVANVAIEDGRVCMKPQGGDWIWFIRPWDAIAWHFGVPSSG